MRIVTAAAIAALTAATASSAQGAWDYLENDGANGEAQVTQLSYASQPESPWDGTVLFAGCNDGSVLGVFWQHEQKLFEGERGFQFVEFQVDDEEPWELEWVSSGEGDMGAAGDATVEVFVRELADGAERVRLTADGKTTDIAVTDAARDGAARVLADCGL